MKRAFIITVAGTSCRFSKSVGYEVLKCLYKENSSPSILEILLEYAKNYFDKIIIVGGYKFDDLQNSVHESDAVKIIFNPHFVDYGSHYSLYLGLVKAINEQCNEIVFAEGDLVVDKGSFVEICEANENVITATRELIHADKSVAFYLNDNGEMKYIYDTEHKQLIIDEPFTLLA
ncbi:MAG: licC domain protein, partial [Bacteroidales bacterium]|nr:licC domain protein [Bacteroidales bacterium]